MSLWISGLLLGVFTGGAGSPVLDQAQKGIATYRQGEAVLELRDGATPLSEVPVRVEQQSHDFLFGTIVRPHHYQDSEYLSRFLELFNFVELLEFNWGQYEPDEGKPLLEERRRFIFEWALPHGVRQFYGHMLVWSTQYGEYPKTQLPLWLFRYEPEEQYRLLRMRVQREVRDYQDVPIVWDVVNEAVHCRRWGDWEKPPYHDEPLEVVFPYVRDALHWAREANPSARLLINDYGVVVSGKYQERFRQLLERIRAEEVPLDAVGIQAHEPYKGAYWFSPEEIWNALELFGTQLGLPIYITELWYVSDPEREIRGNYRSGHWSPERQAEAIEEFYRVAFGHPMVRGIVYFALSDNPQDAVRPQIGLLDEHRRPKPAWERLRRLIREEWWTRAAGKTDANGFYRWRGFYGRYTVVAEAGGRSYRWEVDLRPGQPRHFVLRTADAAK